MKKIIPLLFLIATYTNCFSQGSFAPVGTTWHYDIYANITQSNYPVLIQSTDTATMGGQLCFKIELSSSGLGGIGAVEHNTYYVYESNDSVFCYLQNSNSFGLLYNFNAQVGDTLMLLADGYFGTLAIDTMMYVVTTQGTLSLNGFTKKILGVTNLNPFVEHNLEGDIVEDVGNISFLFPQMTFADPHAAGLRCFQDSIIGLYQTGLVANCNDVVGINELSSHPQITIQPNPFTSNIKIENNAYTANTKISIYDIPGRLVYQTQATELNTELELSALSKGIYMLKISDANFQVTQKIVKQ